jgi:hypothetical protein
MVRAWIGDDCISTSWIRYGSSGRNHGMGKADEDMIPELCRMETSVRAVTAVRKFGGSAKLFSKVRMISQGFAT